MANLMFLTTLSSVLEAEGGGSTNEHRSVERADETHQHHASIHFLLSLSLLILLFFFLEETIRKP